ncbi:MAG: glycosyltransferase [Planctomycetota bacterium]
MPRVSILIPNFNNGPSSSRDGKLDLITLLLQSLHDTLADDPADLEILAHDDGSTDESADTLAQWAQRTWRDNQPFLSLTEGPHHGILAKTTNQLIARCTGDIVVRLDGDTQMLTPHWASRLIALFDAGPTDLGVIAPKQLAPSGRIHAMGDFILHPRGYHHLGFGLPRYALTRPVEVDHAMGCMYCVKREVLDDVGPFDENFLRGQTIDYGIRARLNGWRCVGHPAIEFVHYHGQRKPRDTQADRDAATGKTFDDFSDKWGFSRVVPDLDVVAEKFANTPLLWNAAVFGTPPGLDTLPPTHAADPADTEWTRLASDATAQQQAQSRVQAALQAAQALGQVDRAVLANGAGPLAHMLAQQGLPVTAVDRNPERIAQTRQFTAAHEYPAATPEYRHQPDPRRFPLEDASADLVLLFDLLDTHRNPVGLLTEARRVARPEGLVVVMHQPPPGSAATGTPQAAAAPLDAHGFTQPALLNLLTHLGFTPIAAQVHANTPHAPVIALGKRPAAAQAADAASQAA